MRRAVKYPLLVLLIAVLVSFVGPIFLRGIDPYKFGHFVGELVVYVFIAALIIGWISDRRHKKKNQKGE
jgi:predicted tellurium resistance membrane protein TerC